ncbi:hypothetical protein [Hymenobacter ruricola]|uniref:Uncharacterized protein n=1 Tax=Hymenobacter ruricola TaxID=2791023 RepID=A0ABS0HXS4_9BACT|nr:hypothetical protein [Hymenobacter ruricola]MBF9219503.1 hypothetical protein [Hymenobacter ruricola]
MLLKTNHHNAMLKKMRVTILGSLTLFGVLTLSCQKEQDPTVPMAQHVTVKQSANEDLVGVMAADQLVKDYILADVNFAKEYAVWYNGLAPAEQQQRKAEIDHAVETGQGVSDPAHTAQETAAYNESQQRRMDEIKQKYPQLAALSPTEYADIQARVYDRVVEGYQPQQFADGCVRALSMCLTWCRGQNGGASCGQACWVGYYACKWDREQSA